MVTHNSSSVKLPVRFRVPAPIFAFLLMFFLCCSAGAYSLTEDVTYNLSQFNGYYSVASGSGISDSNRQFHSAGYPLTSTASSAPIKIVFPAGNSPSGNFTVASGTAGNATYFDIFNPSFSNVHFSFFCPYNSDLGTYNALPQVYLYGINSSGTLNNISFIPSYTNFITSLQISVSSMAVCYAHTIDVTSAGATIDVYVAFSNSYNFAGIALYLPHPKTPTTGSWGYSMDGFSFEVSNTRFIVPSAGSGSGGGSVDLSGVTSQINNLSAQMTASFQQVNANIDAAETSIASAISDQTVVLEGAISQAADDVNDHFDSWDSSLSGAYSSSDRQTISEADQVVSEMHQIESDQLDDTQAALDDVDLSGYQLPADYTSGLSEIGTMIGLLFNSFDFITPLIIFSCTLGLASVLIGRKSRGDG